MNHTGSAKCASAPGARASGRHCSAIALAMLLSVCASGAGAAGVTLFTHGSRPPGTEGRPVWLEAMRDAVADARLDGERIYGEIIVSGFPDPTARVENWLGGLGDAVHGEALVLLDWSDVANHLDNGVAVDQVAAAAVDQLTEGQASYPPLVELPLHFIGHSRGTPLLTDLARRLGERGIIVDHLTSLDSHPLTTNDPFQPDPPVLDPPSQIFGNILFAENLYQQEAPYPQGESVAGACNRLFSNLTGGYSGFAGPHSNTHLLYHGTIDLATPVDDGEAQLGAAERMAWFNAYESPGGIGGARAGFAYSRIARAADRRATAAPVAGGDRPIDGYHADPVLGGAGGRVAVDWSQAVWPNLVRLELWRDGQRLGPGPVEIIEGVPVEVRYVVFDADSGVSINFGLDIDRNPYNDNELPPFDFVMHDAAGPQFVAHATTWVPAPLPLDRATYVFARISDGPRRRYLYADVDIQFVSRTGVAQWRGY